MYKGRPSRGCRSLTRWQSEQRSCTRRLWGLLMREDTLGQWSGKILLMGWDQHPHLERRLIGPRSRSKFRKPGAFGTRLHANQARFVVLRLGAFLHEPLDIGRSRRGVHIYGPVQPGHRVAVANLQSMAARLWFEAASVQVEAELPHWWAIVFGATSLFLWRHCLP